MAVLERLLAVLAPWECLICTQQGSLLCPACTIEYLGGSPGRCYHCLGPSAQEALCVDCRPLTDLQQVWVATEYIELGKDLVGKLKFERAQGSVRLLASIMCDRLSAVPANMVVVPLPTAQKRVRQRGYDQAVLLAKTFAKLRGLEYRAVLERHGSSRQVGASKAQRHAQLAQSWRLAKPVQGLNLLLVDDVLTSGATIESAATICMQAGATSVSAVAFAQKL